MTMLDRTSHHRPLDFFPLHVGFAMARIDEAKAQSTLQALQEIGAAYEQEMAELRASRIE